MAMTNWKITLRTNKGFSVLFAKGEKNQAEDIAEEAYLQRLKDDEGLFWFEILEVEAA